MLLAAGLAALLARRAMEPLEEALALQRRFVADASHELRTPLTLLSTRVQLMSRKLESGADVRQDVDGVLTDMSSLNEVLEDLLLVAQAGEGERTRCDIAGLVATCAEAARASAEQRGLALELVDAGPTVASIGEAAVRRRSTSLLDNALDHARSRVQVEVRTSRRHVEVRVADDGPGVPPDVAPRVFDRFASHRPADGSGSRHYGLGLALVAEVAAAHRGSVAVRARDDSASGAVLVLTLPR